MPRRRRDKKELEDLPLVYDTVQVSLKCIAFERMKVQYNSKFTSQPRGNPARGLFLPSDGYS